MIEIKTLEVSGFKGAILGLRNPFKNRDLSDSEFTDASVIGPKDLELCQRLLRTDKDDEAKYLRMIHVQADIRAPLYWWKEFDTYKVATVANSESTMHTIMARPFTLDDFAHDEMTDTITINYLVDTLNYTRNLYLETKNRLTKDPETERKNWYHLIQLLPTSYMQKRTVDLNYQTLRRICFARRNHKLAEWSGANGFCAWVKTLPYAEELIIFDQKAFLTTQANMLRDRWSRKVPSMFDDMLAKGASADELKRLVEFTAYILSSNHAYVKVIESKAKELGVYALMEKYCDTGFCPMETT